LRRWERHEPDNWFAGLDDDNLLTRCGQVDKARKTRLGFVNIDGLHGQFPVMD
jgi:hypothetical protein